MKEIKQKFIEAIKAIDFSKLSIQELNITANTMLMVKDFGNEPNEYLKFMTDKFEKSSVFQGKETLEKLR